MEVNYYILGCGGFAKEVFFLAQQALGGNYKFRGFIDEKPILSTIEVRKVKVSIIDQSYFLAKVKPLENVVLFMGIGNPAGLAKLAVTFADYSFPNLIHPSFIGDYPSIKMGVGNIITAGCIFTVDITIGSYNIFNLNTTVGHDTVIGNCNIFNPGTNVSGGVKIGSRNLLGTNSTILQTLQIQDDNILGAASLANKNIESGSIMVGVPAKKMVK